MQFPFTPIRSFLSFTFLFTIGALIVTGITAIEYYIKKRLGRYTLGYRILEEQEFIEDTSSSMAYDLELPVDITQKSSSRQDLLKKFSSKQKLFGGSGPKHSTGHQHDPVTTLRRHLSSKRDDSDIRKQDTRSGCLIRKPSGPKYLRNGRVQGISMNFDDSTYSDLE